MTHKLASRLAAAWLCLIPASAVAAGVPDAVAKRVNAQTFAAVRMNVAGVDPATWGTWGRTLFKQAGAPQSMLDDMSPKPGHPSDADKTYAGLKESGAAEAWVVVALGSGDQPVDVALILTDVKSHDAAKAVAAELHLTQAADGTAVVLASGPALLDGVAPAPRPDLFGPITAAGGQTNVASVVVPQQARDLLKAGLPTLPPDVGGGSSDVVADGVRTLAITVDAPPAFGAKLAVTAKDAASAAKLADFLAGLGKAAQRQHAPEPEMSAVADELKPTVAGDTLTIAVDQPRAERLAKALVPVLVKSRAAAKEAQSASNLHQLGLACLMYANEHQDAYPASVDDLKPYLYGAADAVLRNPRREASPGYVYVKPPEGKTSQVTDSAGRLIMYEAGGFTGDDVNVLFADGHVEAVRDGATFKRLLTAAQTPAK